jgi:hypothetical protein
LRGVDDRPAKIQQIYLQQLSRHAQRVGTDASKFNAGFGGHDQILLNTELGFRSNEHDPIEFRFGMSEVAEVKHAAPQIEQVFAS